LAQFGQASLAISNLLLDQFRIVSASLVHVNIGIEEIGVVDTAKLPGRKINPAQI
jgi:hypothetical protein